MQLEQNKDAKNPYVRWLFSHALKHVFLFTINFIGIIAVCYLRTVIPVFIGDLIDSLIADKYVLTIFFKEYNTTVLYLILILLGIYFLNNATEYATWMIGHQLGSKTEQSMRREFFENVQNKPLSFHDGVKTGDLQALATNDLRVVNTFIAHG